MDPNRVIAGAARRTRIVNNMENRGEGGGGEGGGMSLSTELHSAGRVYTCTFGTQEKEYEKGNGTRERVGKGRGLKRREGGGRRGSDSVSDWRYTPVTRVAIFQSGASSEGS